MVLSFPVFWFLILLFLIVLWARMWPKFKGIGESFSFFGDAIDEMMDEDDEDED